MRLAPVVLHAMHDPAALARIADEQGRVTHDAPQARQACVWFADMLRRAILGERKETLFTAPASGEHPAIEALKRGGWRTKLRSDIKSSGYVIDTLEAALWAVDQTSTFEDALVLAVNLGDDADTVGAVTGQLAGALYGLSDIPQRWVEPLAWRPRIMNMADALLRHPDGRLVARL